MATIFDTLSNVQARPAMYLGFGQTRGEDLRVLSHFLRGYQVALSNHDVDEPTSDFARDFGTFIFERAGISASQGPIEGLLQAAGDGEKAWSLFWELFDQFRATLTAP